VLIDPVFEQHSRDLSLIHELGIEQVEGDFRIQIDRQASASEEVIAYLQERMKLCPISKNLPESVAQTINVTTMA